MDSWLPLYNIRSTENRRKKKFFALFQCNPKETFFFTKRNLPLIYINVEIDPIVWDRLINCQYGLKEWLYQVLARLIYSTLLRRRDTKRKVLNNRSIFF